MMPSADHRRNTLGQASPVLLVLAILNSWNPVSAQTQETGGPSSVIDALHDALIEVASRSETLSYESRFDELEPAIDSSHDFPTIARLVGGRFWRDLNDDDRSLFIEAFRRASIATYATRFASAEGVQFDPSVVQETLGARATVRSHLIRKDGSPVEFDYVLQLTNAEWRIVTILVDGVSDLALQRAELTKLYSDTGFQGVIEYLEAKADGA